MLKNALIFTLLAGLLYFCIFSDPKASRVITDFLAPTKAIPPQFHQDPADGMEPPTSNVSLPPPVKFTVFSVMGCEPPFTR